VAALLVAACAAACRSPVAGGPPAIVDERAAAAVARERGLAARAGEALAVPPFEWRGEDARLGALGYALADLLITDLSRSRALRLVERARLGALLTELDLAGAGRVDSATAPRVGRLIQARRLILGTVDTLPSGEFRLGVRIADVETGRIAAAVDARASAVDLLSAEKVLVYRLFDALGVTPTPAERAAIDAERPAVSLTALVAFGEGVRAELQGNTRAALSAYGSAALLAPELTVARARANALRPGAQGAAEPSALAPGVRPINATVAGAVDRVNRPLDLFTSFARPLSGPGDPAFPGTVATIVIEVRRP
jgi:TolB-like protein